MHRVHRLAQRAYRWHYLDLALVALLVIVIAITNAWWIATESRPPHWDMGRHLWTSLLYRDTLHGGSLLPFLQEYHYYPPLVYWWVQPWYHAFGESVQVAVNANILYVTTLVVSTYAAGRKLAGRRVGLGAAVLVASYPMFVTQFKEYQLDAPLAAMVALAMCLLIYSEYFRRPRFTLAFGAACGLGMLTKWTFVACIALPALLALIVAIRADIRARAPRRLTFIVFAALLAYAIASPWYVANIQQFRIDMKANGAAQAKLEGDPTGISWAALSWYAKNLINQQVFLIGAGLALGSAALTLMSPLRTLHLRRLALPLALVIGMYLVFSLLPNKDPRYTLPMLPALALLTCYPLATLRRRNLAFAAIIAYGAITFAAISFGTSLLPKNAVFHLGATPITVFAQHGYIIGAPTHEDWGVAQAFAYVRWQPAASRSLSYRGDDTMWLNSWDLQYFGELDGVQLSTWEKSAYHLIRTSGAAEPGSVWQQRLPDGGSLALYHN